MTTVSDTTGRRSTAGYAHVNGLDMYHEVHGTGRPLVLLHGGLLTIDLSFGAVLPALAASRRVIGVELQGHGHTADTDRELTLEYLAGDVVALLDHLGVDRADLFGFSLGGLVALQLTMSYPERVDRLVLAATHYRPDGYHAEIRSPDAQPGSGRMPTERDFQEMHEAYARVAPNPDHFHAFMAKASAAVDAFQGWPADSLREITTPTLLVVGDTDFVRLEHAVEMYELIPGSQLAVLPGTTHMDLMRRSDLVVPMVESFLPSR
ncbi:MAG: alpha/beta fold hydrolase [Streptosporangiales bacterium]|nr:alpha/beta fold hydrolase [Streptosporangiales bacterium]